eukprot:scaffold4433_cov122-Cylindrotheca_fusiformis.AAC.1
MSMADSVVGVTTIRAEHWRGYSYMLTNGLAGLRAQNQEMCETTTEEAWDAFKDNCNVVVAQATGRRNVRTLARRTTLYHTM